MTISVALSVTTPYKQRATGINIEHVREEIVDDLVRRIMGSPESETVILRPSMCGSPLSPRHGVWGVDEPHPCPDLVRR
ncbi:hypothetical protein [Sphingomonas beigongshangi]|uniref:hypothetical protein n=1 Tax=Sphingomonas beigongshangi TaxID=2782540 RepID=UPI00193BE730|nr:hypothetical protein [Sphingomonas beigongshangi]